MNYTKIKSGVNEGKYQDDEGNVFSVEEVTEEEIKNILRPDRQIKTKVRIGFGDGVYRSKESLDKIKKEYLNEL